MKNSLETRLGYLVALVVICAVVILEVLGGFNRLRGGYPLHALFDNVHELKAGDPVKMAGVQIGTVDSLQITNNKVMVNLKIDQGREVRTDSKATIKFTGLLGQNFVSLDFGSLEGRKAEPNAFLSTVEQADLGQIMTKLDSVASGVDNLAKTFSGDNINNLLGPITDFLKENRENLSGSISNLHSISSQIASGQGTVGKLIYTSDLHDHTLDAVTNLQEALTDARITLAEARKTVEEINAGKGTLGKLTHDEALYNEATASMTNLREILEKINHGQGSVGKLVNDETFLDNAKLSLQKLDKATEGLEDQGPLSILGIVAGKLF